MSDAQENHTLLRSLSEALTQRIWVVCIITSLVVTWCVLDAWNHDMSSQLYQMSEVKGDTLQSFKYTLTLTALQFAFVGVVSCSIFAGTAASAGKSVSQSLEPGSGSSLADGRWSALVISHVFGSVLLQSLMMPAQMMSLSLFAATRAVEVPVASVVRANIVTARSSGPSLRTTMMMFAAAWLLFFSYTQIAECLCVWSGFGVALTGVPLYCVYALLLTLPATNAVLQESVLVQLQVNPMLMLAIQNLGAAALFMPILLAAHLLGYEDVQHAAAMIMGHREIYMTVLWLCVQTMAISMVTVGLILTVDSFWAVAARSLRVVFWWARQLQLFYLTSSTMLSVARPHASLWSFVMVCGILLGFTAFVTDRRQPEDIPEDKYLLASSERVGKYV